MINIFNLNSKMTKNSCKHGVYIHRLNCLICNPEKTNKCTCDNQGYCELCKEFKPICKKINDLCEEMMNKNKIDTSGLCEKI